MISEDACMDNLMRYSEKQDKSLRINSMSITLRIIRNVSFKEGSRDSPSLSPNGAFKGRSSEWVYDPNKVISDTCQS